MGISYDTNHLTVFAVHNDGHLRLKTYRTSTDWGPWYDAGDAGNGVAIVGMPDVASRGADRADIVARSADGRVLYKRFDSAGWWPSLTDWVTLSYNVSADPRIVASNTMRFDVFVVDTDGVVWHLPYRDS